MSDGMSDAPPSKRPRTGSPAEESAASPPAAALLGTTQLPMREWKGPVSASSSGFKLVSYNILAPGLATATAFPFVTTGKIEWGYRWPLIQAQLEGIDADLVCLQEVEEEYHKADLEPYFTAKGYEVRCRTVKKELWRGGPVVSFGTATFWKTSTFELVGGDAFKSLDMKTLFDRGEKSHKKMLVGTPPRPDVSEDCWPDNPPPSSSLLDWTPMHHQAHAYFWNWFFWMHHGGVAVTLRHKGTGKLVIVGNFHALANKHASLHKALQTALVTVALDKMRQSLAGQDVSIVLAGDFNATPTIRLDETCERVDQVLKYQDEVLSKGKTTRSGLSVLKPHGASESDAADLKPVELSAVPSAPYQLLTTGTVEQGHPHHFWVGTKKVKKAVAEGSAGAGDAASPAEEYEYIPLHLHPSSVPDVHIPLRFVSAYAQVQGREPAWTNAHDKHDELFKETLDYIFVATASREISIMPLPGDKEREVRKWLEEFKARQTAREAAMPPAGGKPRGPPTGIPVGDQAVPGPWVPINAGSVVGGAGGAGGSAPGTVLTPVAVLAIPSENEVTRFEGGENGCCPNAGHGSDHIPIAAYFEWK